MGFKDFIKPTMFKVFNVIFLIAIVFFITSGSFLKSMHCNPFHYIFAGMLILPSFATLFFLGSIGLIFLAPLISLGVGIAYYYLISCLLNKIKKKIYIAVYFSLMIILTILYTQINPCGDLKDTLTIPEPELGASPEDPIVLISDQLELKNDRITSVPVRYYWVESGEVHMELNCDEKMFSSTPQFSDKGVQKMFRIIIPEKSFESDIICTLSAVSDEQVLHSKEIKFIVH